MPVDQAERGRRRRLVQAHMAAENAHDLDAIMETFAPDGEMIFNASPFDTPEAIALAHAGFGMSASPGALENLRVVPLREYITDDEIVIEGQLEGVHTADFFGYAPSNRQITMPYVAVYRFDASGKLASERVVMNFAPFGKPE